MANNNFENLLNLTNNDDVKNLIGNFVKVVNNNLEKSINKDKDQEEDIIIDTSKKSSDDIDDNISESATIGSDLELDENIVLITNTLKKLFTDKNGNNIADILSNLSSNIAKNNKLLQMQK